MPDLGQQSDTKISLASSALRARWYQDPIFNTYHWCTSGIVQQVQGFNNQVRTPAHWEPAVRLYLVVVHSHSGALRQANINNNNVVGSFNSATINKHALTSEQASGGALHDSLFLSNDIPMCDWQAQPPASQYPVHMTHCLLAVVQQQRGPERRHVAVLPERLLRLVQRAQVLLRVQELRLVL